MSNIIAFAGAKQSGKTTSVNFLHGHEMKSHGFIKEFFIDEGGRLVVNAKYLDDNDKEFESMGVFDVFQESQTLKILINPKLCMIFCWFPDNPGKGFGCFKKHDIGKGGIDKGCC